MAAATATLPELDQPTDSVHEHGSPAHLAEQQRSDAAWRPKANIWAIALTVSLATFMEVLDSSIANVALPHIAGSLGASQDEATWVLTSYLVSNAVILPASAYLTTFIGRKKFYMICVVLFGISSMLCGLAPSLPILIFCRVLQGAGGGEPLFRFLFEALIADVDQRLRDLRVQFADGGGAVP